MGYPATATAVLMSLAGFTAAAIMPAPAWADSGDRFVAIAYSPATGNIETATDAISAQRAAEIALDSCKDSHGPCELAAWARTGCVALALNAGGQWAGGSGPDASAAQSAAMSKAADGYIAVVRCTS